jgi:hypothetical protein
MNFVEPLAEELALLRADPLIFEQELDVRPLTAKSLEKSLGFRAGRKFWRARSGILYAIELGDFGRGLPSMALISGYWPRYDPRPGEDAINTDLSEFAIWLASVCDGLDPSDVETVLSNVAIIRQRAK